LRRVSASRIDWDTGDGVTVNFDERPFEGKGRELSWARYFSSRWLANTEAK
jgi:hypothetical protein